MTTSQESDDQQSIQQTSNEAPVAVSEQSAPEVPEQEAEHVAEQATEPAALAETEAVLASVEATEAPSVDPAPSDEVTSEAPTPAPASSTEEAPAESAAPAPAAPKPGVPKPGKAPKPSNLPRPAAQAGQGKATSATAPASPMPAPSFTTPLEDAAKFAKVSDDGHVILIDGAEEHPVGQFPDGTKDEALAYFSRKYDEVVSQVMLLEQRVATGAPAGEIQKTLGHLRQTIGERGMVGDMPALRARVEALQTRLDDLKLAEKLALEKAQAQQLATREAIVAEAEELAAKDPQQVQWKQASARMAELFENWKAAQKAGPRLGKSVEDGLWKRFRTARTTHDKHRRAFFSQLDATNSKAKSAKEKLIARAEALSTSTDWGPTAGAYRDLMDEWKAAPRASRKEDDALWARFRAAQDVFFNARKATNDEIDKEYGENLKVKEQILAEGQKLLPVKDVKAARKVLNDLRGRWEDAGRVPRKDVSRMESAFRKLEEGLKSAEDEHWRKTNPETKARTNSALTQLEDKVAELEDDLAKAQSKGDAKAIAKAQEALDARKMWLETLQKSAQGLR
ncbi:hypothetical protein GCM10010977_22240 [Citricoccus zhacaiensis]|uniref:DUF349 domain-containing protein n=1 Tax=Citricoccus zhacaiensis TaxID=489142 RepID=A0ABQ2M441_9MICC|nr:DUF349 domain-containing protein [Citricoccus zhacaiensis]GGO46693.1 hypothetical protein GCM10010977_22240 [Citricoccus zhacaiensis]